MYVYPQSVYKRGDSEYCIAVTDGVAVLSVSGSDIALFDGTETSQAGVPVKLCPLTVANSKIIRKLFDFTNPGSHKGSKTTIGLGDRLGLATPGHIRAVRDLEVFPVFAQQSMRELNLTGRTYDDVLAAAVWAVFREGYTKGYGADGDHLKTHDEIKHAIDCGYTMITLDCSEHIQGDLESSSEAVIKHVISIYNDLIKGTDVDFEVSIDETLTATSPQSHYSVARELIKQGVEITSLAPRFVGEFQKGIDYIGSVSGFEQDFLEHKKIAEELGYKLSIHSGSDKFSIFPVIGRLTGGKFHLKTAGTSWLEAVRVIAQHEPELYREMHIFALDNLQEAKKYYSITENTSNIADINNIEDTALVDYLDQDDARRVLHITYGLILLAKTKSGEPLFRDRIYKALNTYESEYSAALDKHIGKHLYALGQVNK